MTCHDSYFGQKNSFCWFKPKINNETKNGGKWSWYIFWCKTLWLMYVLLLLLLSHGFPNKSSLKCNSRTYLANYIFNQPLDNMNQLLGPWPTKSVAALITWTNLKIQELFVHSSRSCPRVHWVPLTIYSAVCRLIIQGRTSITGGEQMKISFCGHEPIWYFFSLITQNSVSSKLTHHFEMYESILFCCFLNCSNLTKHATYYTSVFSYFRLGGNWFTSARVYLNDSLYKKKLFVLKCKKCL